MAKRAKYGDTQRCLDTAARVARDGALAALLRDLDKLADHWQEAGFGKRCRTQMPSGKARASRMQAGGRVLAALALVVEWPTDARVADLRERVKAFTTVTKARKA